MKKLVIFLSLAMMLLVVGCQKEDIRPNTTNQTSTDSANEKANRGGGVDDDIEKPGGGSITDPNHDEDEDGKSMK